MIKKHTETKTKEGSVVNLSMYLWVDAKSIVLEIGFKLILLERTVSLRYKVTTSQFLAEV